MLKFESIKICNVYKKVLTFYYLEERISEQNKMTIANAIWHFSII